MHEAASLIVKADGAKVFQQPWTCPDADRSNGTSQSASDLRGLQVLLVEDDDADVYLIMQALKTNPRVGAVIRVRDGVEAIDWIDTHRPRPDLAIVDLRMPRKDGLQLLHEMSARVTVDFPSIVLTSSHSSQDMAQSTRRGATKFITKKDTVGELALALNGVIDTL